MLLLHYISWHILSPILASTSNVSAYHSYFSSSLVSCNVWSIISDYSCIFNININPHINTTNANLSWFPDFGASNYITSSSTNPPYSSPYCRTGKLLVDNCNASSISHIGSSSISLRNWKLILCNIIIIPQITKNLLWISQIVKDNHASFLFHCVSCLVECLHTHHCWRVVNLEDYKTFNSHRVHMTQLNLWCLLYGHVSTLQSLFVVSDGINSCENKNVPLLWNRINSFVETSLTSSFPNNNAYFSVGYDNSNLTENVTTIDQHLDYLLSISSTSHTYIIIWHHKLRHFIFYS